MTMIIVLLFYCPIFLCFAFSFFLFNSFFTPLKRDEPEMAIPHPVFCQHPTALPRDEYELVSRGPVLRKLPAYDSMRDDEMTTKPKDQKKTRKIHCFADPTKVLDVIFLGQPSKSTTLTSLSC